jgi:hypothetical protein
MRKDLWRTALAATLACWFLSAAESRAQGIAIWSNDYDRALAPGAVLSPGQEPFSHRYNYYAGPAFYLTFGQCPSKWSYIEYIDRVERAERFGYRIPAPPPCWAPVYSRPRCGQCVNP